MNLWLKVRGGWVILGAIVLTLAGLILPVSAAAATPSPAGATLAAACFLALTVPVAVGWGCARGDPQLEGVSVRSIHAFDFLLAVMAVGGTSLSALLMYQAGVAPAGAIAARAALVYLGLMLLAHPFVGWRIATIVPAIYLVAVAVVGRGEDIFHPAAWAWIAAEGGARSSWLLTSAVLVAGIGAYLVLKSRNNASPVEE